MKRILCIWIPDWPWQRLRLTNLELAERPVAIHRQHASRGRRVALCSPAAKALGIRQEMPLAEASALAESGNRPSSTLHLVADDPLTDRQQLVRLAQWCERFSPLVGLEDAERPESLLADITGLAALFGGERSLAVRAARDFRRQGYHARLAVAGTLGAAWAIAHYHPAVRKHPVRITAEETAAALAALPVEALRLAEADVEMLGRLGIDRIGQLAALPREGLVARFGSPLITRLDQAQGTADEVILAIHPQPECAAHWALEYPTDRREMIERVLESLISRVAAMLAERGDGALHLVCRLRGERRAPETLEVGLFQPSASTDHLFELARLQLQRHSSADPVAEISVQVTRSAPLAVRQRELFAEDRPRTDLGQLAPLVDRLSGRLGRQAVVRPRLAADAQPELAWREEPLVGPTVNPPRRRRTNTAAAHLKFELVDRPIYLLPRPVPLKVLCAARSGPPTEFRIDHQTYRRARHWGPERIETGWWRRRGVRRDYYRVETTTGQRFWLFQRLHCGQWFWQGEFG